MPKTLTSTHSISSEHRPMSLPLSRSWPRQSRRSTPGRKRGCLISRWVLGARSRCTTSAIRSIRPMASLDLRTLNPSSSPRSEVTQVRIRSRRNVQSVSASRGSALPAATELDDVAGSTLGRSTPTLLMGKIQTLSVSSIRPWQAR